MDSLNASKEELETFASQLLKEVPVSVDEDRLPTLTPLASCTDSISPSTSGSTSGNTSGSRKQDSRKNGRSTNVDRCRKYYRKKRKEEAQVVKENVDLKLERTALQEQIAELEVEVQTLRGQEFIDLSKENELLSREIEKHREYIDNVVRATKETPLKIEQEERHLRLKSGVEAAVGHLVGILYCSMTDSSWKEGQSFQVLDGLTCKVRYQLLPTGSSFENAQRATVRIDCNGFPLDPEDLMDHMVSIAKDRDKWEANFQAQDTELLKNVKREAVNPTIHYDDGEFIACSRFSIKGSTPEQSLVFAYVEKSLKLSPSAFSQHRNGDDDHLKRLEPEDCKLFVGTTIDVSDKEVCLEADRLRPSQPGFHSEAFVVRRGKDNGSNFSSVYTQPMQGIALNMPPVIVDASGEVNEEFIGLMNDSLALAVHTQQR